MTIWTLPTPAEFLAGIAVWSDPFFDEFLPIVYIPIGLTVACLVLLFLIGKVQEGLSWLFEGKKEGLTWEDWKNR